MSRKQLSIGALARQLGIQSSAIRYYERVGLLPVAARESGRRSYDSSAVDLLLVIRAGRQAGLSISDLKHLVRGFSAGAPASARWRAVAERKLIELDASIAHARALKRLLTGALACRRLDIRECGRILRARS
jgi:MerR family redox-sensitive transcriptional activator SoxR